MKKLLALCTLIILSACAPQGKGVVMSKDISDGPGYAGSVFDKSLIPQMPVCNEDEVIFGLGAFDGRFWAEYVCVAQDKVFGAPHDRQQFERWLAIQGMHIVPRGTMFHSKGYSG